MTFPRVRATDIPASEEIGNPDVVEEEKTERG